MTRIISGFARGARLVVPKSGTRPTSDRVREAIFSTAESFNLISGAKILDLFAGSGSLGLEAISRGAAECIFVEKHGPAANIIRDNWKTVQSFLKKEATPGAATPSARVEKMSALTFLETALKDEEFEIIFIDPPYDFSENVLGEIITKAVPFLAAHGVLAVERDTRSGEPEWPTGVSTLKEKRYGETTLWWAEKVNA